jgi:hypothetical protein
MVQHIFHNRVPHDEDILDARLEALLVCVEEMIYFGFGGGRAVEVGGRAHDGYAGVVDEVGEGAAEEDFEVCVVCVLGGFVSLTLFGSCP